MEITSAASGVNDRHDEQNGSRRHRCNHADSQQAFFVNDPAETADDKASGNDRQTVYAE